MPPTPPSWFKQRQLNLEAAGENCARVSGPNAKEAFLGVRPGGGGLWAGYLRDAQDGPDVAATGPRFAAAPDAWEGAFELYRQTYVI